MNAPRTPVHGARHTVQKEAVQRALEACDGFVSAGSLHRRLEDQGTGIGLATVYRNLNALHRAGLADSITTPGGQVFRACGSQRHHHHLVCENCGRSVEIDMPDESWLRDVAERNGFTLDRHVLEAFGLCERCRKP